MAISGRRVRIQEKTDSGMVTLFPDTVAERVWCDEETTVESVLNRHDDSITAVQNSIDSVRNRVDEIETQGVGVTGVKGEAETSYRKGEVNITKANIGLGNVVNKGMDASPIANSENYIMSGGVAAGLNSLESNLTTKINEVTAIAEGKTATYVIDTTNTDTITINGISRNNKNSTLFVDKTTTFTSGTLVLQKGTDAIKTVDGQSIKSEDLKNGDIILILASNSYDWWVHNVSNQSYITLYPFEAEKVDLTDYATKTYADGVLTKTNSSLETNNKTVLDAINEVNANANQGIGDASSAIAAVEAVDEKVDNITNGTTAVGKANKLSTARTITLSGDTTGSTTFDGSKDVTITTTVGNGKITSEKIATSAVTTVKIADGAITSAKILDGTITNADINASANISNSKLADSGVTAGTYSVVEVNSKGIVTKGANYIEYGSSTNNTPSDDLVVGGLFFSYISEI